MEKLVFTPEELQQANQQIANLLEAANASLKLAGEIGARYQLNFTYHPPGGNQASFFTGWVASDDSSDEDDDSDRHVDEWGDPLPLGWWAQSQC